MVSFSLCISFLVIVGKVLDWSCLENDPIIHSIGNFAWLVSQSMDSWEIEIEIGNIMWF